VTLRISTHLRAVLLAACLAVISPAQDTGLRIVCSNGIRAAMEKLLPKYERTKIQFGASAVLKRSIEGEEPFDVAILTPQLIEALIKEGKIAAGTKVDIATTGIGFAVRADLPKPDVSTPQAIKQTLLKAGSIGYVKEGASTPAILGMLDRLGIQAEVQAKTVFQPGAGPSMASVAEGHTAIAIGLISEIVPAPGVQLAGPFPPEFQKPIGMSAGIASSTKNRAAADKFLQWLLGPEASAAIQATGLEPARAANPRP
jgi:molybdate transport system substrate-binding protein